jgi:hypothetical protein
MPVPRTVTPRSRVCVRARARLLAGHPTNVLIDPLMELSRGNGKQLSVSTPLCERVCLDSDGRRQLWNEFIRLERAKTRQELFDPCGWRLTARSRS